MPALVRQWGVLQGVDPLSAGNAAYAFVWIAVGHAIQYLWITTYLARSSGRAASLPRFYGRSLLAGIAIWTIPALVFAPGLLGRLPYDAGLGMLVGAMVNLHHFVLDGAIWKLRDGRIARVLIRSSAAPQAGPALSLERRFGVWPVVAAAGALSIAIVVATVWLYEAGFRRALVRGDLAGARSAVGWLARVGRDSPEYHIENARVAVQQRRWPAAISAVERSLTLHPTPAAWVAKGQLLEAQGRLREAIDAYQNAVALDPRQAMALYRAGLLWLRIGDAVEARKALAAAVQLAPHNPELRRALASVPASPGVDS